MNSVEFFHDLSGRDVAYISKKILEDGIHILFNWDGYSNNGVRATGLFPIQSAPIQVVHLEYVGTMGADYIQYCITDRIASPIDHAKYYSEKFLYMPHSFFANSFPYQRPDMFDPVYDTDWDVVRDVFQRSHNINVDDIFNVSTTPNNKPFIYCQFNKHLKISPLVFIEWLKVLQETENSILLLLENPTESIQFFESFIQQYDGSLLNRVFFAKFLNNPYDNQFRVSRVCNVVLDNPTYNSHTTAVDALWGGTPVVTLGNDRHMAGRVAQSILTAIGLPELIANDYKEFVEIASRLCKHRHIYLSVRKRLVDENMKSIRNLTLTAAVVDDDDDDDDEANGGTDRSNSEYVIPNRYWDLKKYTRDMERGLAKIWEYYLDTGGYKHMSVYDDDDVSIVDSDPLATDDIVNFSRSQRSSSSTLATNYGLGGRGGRRLDCRGRRSLIRQNRPAYIYAAKYYFSLPQ